MKFVLYSDIHAQIPQLEAVQAEVDKENADKEIVIGDLIMLGPEPSEVVDNIRARDKTDVIIGNLDLWVVNKRWETHEPHSPHQAWMFGMAKPGAGCAADIIPRVPAHNEIMSLEFSQTHIIQYMATEPKISKII